MPSDPAVSSGAWLGIWSITLNAGMVVAGWLAVNGNVGCGYITKFLAAATVVISPLVIVALIKPEKPAPLRGWVSHITDALMVAMMVWNGWLWCAGAFAYGWLLCFILFAARKAHAANVKDQATASDADSQHEGHDTSGCLQPFCSPLPPPTSE